MLWKLLKCQARVFLEQISPKCLIYVKYIDSFRYCRGRYYFIKLKKIPFYVTKGVSKVGSNLGAIANSAVRTIQRDVIWRYTYTGQLMKWSPAGNIKRWTGEKEKGDWDESKNIIPGLNFLVLFSSHPSTFLLYLAAVKQILKG